MLAVAHNAPSYAASVDPALTVLAAVAWMLGGTVLWAGRRWVHRHRAGVKR